MDFFSIDHIKLILTDAGIGAVAGILRALKTDDSARSFVKTWAMSVCAALLAGIAAIAFELQAGYHVLLAIGCGLAPVVASTKASDITTGFLTFFGKQVPQEHEDEDEPEKHEKP